MSKTSKKIGSEIRNHLQTAISFLIPIVCGAGFLIAIGNAFGGDNTVSLINDSFGLWDIMSVMGAAALGLLPVIISTGISYSIVGKPGIAPGFIVGLAANEVGAGFIGGILGGFIAGYLAQWLIKAINAPSWARGLMPTIIVPFTSSLVSILLMVYIVGGPIAWFTDMLTNFLTNLNTSSSILFGGIIGLLSGVDYGGPINKTVFAFVLSMQAEGVNEPITALQLVNTATPIGFALAQPLAKLFNKHIYTDVEHETIKSAGIMGVFNIVEGVIPVVMNDLWRGIFATAVGGFVGGAVSMTLGADATVPFGGVLMLPTMSRPMAGVLALLANILATALTYALVKKHLSPEERTAIKEVSADDEEDIDLGEIQIS